jgi:hypothetical protein
MPRWTGTIPVDWTVCNVIQLGLKIARRNAKLAATCHPKPMRKNIIVLNLCNKKKITQPFPSLFY